MPAHNPALTSGPPVLVIGAGIAGLSAAIALRQIGVPVMVLEQSSAISEVGAGLQISPNGTRVLRALGLEPARFSTRTAAVELRDRRGRFVTGFAPRSDPGFFLIHRADLVQALADRLLELGGEIELGAQVESVEIGGGASLNAGGERCAPLMIGADGLHSRMRMALNGTDAPFFTGQVAWRATIPGDGGAPVAQVFMGPGRHLVSYPLRRGALRNIVAIEERAAWAAEGWHHADDPAALRAAFSGFGGPVPQWLEAVETPFLWGLFRHPVAARWHDGQGRAAILGDAAHPTLPFLAQGANLALEDAWVLADALARHAGDRGAALTWYQDRRAARVAAVIAAANANARNYHLRPPLAPLAHTVLRLADLVAPGLPFRRYAWVHDHDVTAP
ncbi:MAG: salicylate hydroxylase [Rhodobacteraceae bacterium HLUCCA12]|nr:MAG: salicylate hydroxylase [Rhodobacteraceae bacterium HLUCCA12]